jgi:hypothetical protein
MSLSTSNRYLAFLSVMLLMAYKWQCIPKKQGILMALQYIMKMNQLIHKTARNSPICEVLHEAIIQLLKRAYHMILCEERDTIHFTIGSVEQSTE